MIRFVVLIFITIVSFNGFSQTINPYGLKSANDLKMPGLIEYPYYFKYEGNPLARNTGASDPSVHVWDGTVWMYTSLDHAPGYSAMDGYHAWSSTDMVNWTDYGDVFNSSMLKTSSWGNTQKGWMWAPGAARKQDANGVWTYYLYYPHNKAAAGAGEDWVTGVATAPNPWGPFTDQGILGGYPSWKAAMDPMVFIDDDGQAYIYANSAKVAKLNANMVSLAEAPKNIDYAPASVKNDMTLHFGEGSYMHKKDGVYYYSYSNFNNNTYQAFYATGKSPYGPFEWRGPMAPAPKGAQDHHSIIEFKDQSYYFYHIAVGNYPVVRDGQSRIACFDRLYYNKDGTIQMVVHTTGPTKLLKTNAPNGSVILDPPGGAYASGTTIKVSVISDLGYAFNGWSGSLNGSMNPVTIVMDTDKTISASFVPTPTYTLSATSDKGSVVLNPSGGKYNAGDEVLLTPGKVFGYKFSYWSGDLSGSVVPGKITMNSNKRIVANYVALPTYKLTSSATNGIIELSPTGVSFEEGTVVTLTAKKDYGYEFNGWSGDTTGIKNPITLVMNSDKNITANFFYKGDGKIVFATNCGGNDFRSADGVYYKTDNKYSSGSTYSTTSTITGTTDGALYQTNRFSNSFNYKIPLPNKEYKVTLMFAEIFHSSANSRVFDVFIEGVKVSGNLDVFAKVGKNVAYNETHNVTVTDGELNIALTSIKDNANISAIKVVEVDHTPTYKLETTSINGSVALNPIGGFYKEGTEVAIKANPNFRFVFRGWGGDKSGSLNPDTIIMNGDKKVIAYFTVDTGIDDLQSNFSEHAEIGQNYPNPFQTGTTIPYSLSKASYVRISIFNYLGQQVATLVNEFRHAGKYKVYWDAKNNQGKQLESGFYSYRLETDKDTLSGGKLLIYNRNSVSNE